MLSTFKRMIGRILMLHDPQVFSVLGGINVARKEARPPVDGLTCSFCAEQE